MTFKELCDAVAALVPDGYMSVTVEWERMGIEPHLDWSIYAVHKTFKGPTPESVLEQLRSELHCDAPRLESVVIE